MDSTDLSSPFSPVFVAGTESSFDPWLETLARAGMGVMLFERGGRCLCYNTIVQKLLGPETLDPEILLDYASFIGAIYDLAIDDEDMAALPGLYTNFTAGCEGEFVEVIATRASPLILVRMIPLGQYRVAALFINLQGMGQQQATHQETSRQNNLLFQAVDYAQSGILLFDPHLPSQPIMFVNQALCSLLGSSRDVLLGQDWRKILPEVDPTFETFKIFKYTSKDKDRYYGCTLSILPDTGLVFVSDVTETVEQEQQLRQMQKLDSLGQLAGGIAHDFNNVLGIIRGYGQLLYNKHRDDPVLGQPLASIVAACERGAGLTDKLMTFSRKKTADPATSRLQDVLTQIEGLLRPVLPINISFVTTAPPEAIYVACGSDGLNQILMNLVINARDACGEQGMILVDTQKISGAEAKEIWPGAVEGKAYVRLNVIDNGAGMEPDVVKRIFEPFFTTKEAGKGTGLGLSVVYGVLQQQGGHITVHSTPGTGTTFSVYLPLSDESAMPVPANDGAQEINDPSILKSRRVLVVDDEGELRQTLVMHFEQLGMTVLQAESGDAALAMQDEDPDPIDILVSDVHMPGLNGGKLAELWREIRPNSRIVLVSGYPKNADIRDDLVDAFLVKPIDYGRMTTLLQSLFQAGYNRSVQRVQGWKTG